MSDNYFLIPDEERKKLLVWHSWLNGDDGDRGGNRGDRARLRRAESAEDILLTNAFFRFLQQMPDGFPQEALPDQRLPVAAAIAGLLAHVKTNNSSLSFARQLATPLRNKGKAPMSELRFQQLQKSPTVEDFYRRMIRAIRLLDKTANVLSLTNDIIHWHREFNQPLGRHPAKRLAVRWATHYFTALTQNSD